ncbi:hypothetical protein [Prescottella agglutinans]|jgi:hypothetical protein|uniref:Uncharacterized protein n=1 Tax=Prescottella agglutinans TaxID=1644129 RepID=A0ABT6MKI5_9NOCA|nr:hypothetical protein [Prescottella agglutinans]MDH6284828.1 hypothetical protein [Prescottella agglutinans]
MSKGPVTPQNWERYQRAEDCPQCEGDSNSFALVGDGVHEIRQCYDDPSHQFEAEAYYTPASSADATVFNLRD